MIRKDLLEGTSRIPLKLCSAYHFSMSFDNLSGIADAIGANGNQFDAGGNLQAALSSTSRWAYGKSLTYQNGGNRTANKAGANNQQTWFVACGFLQGGQLNANGASFGFYFYDGGSVQCLIYFFNDGSIVVTQGDFLSVQATFTGAVQPFCFDHWQIKVIIHNTAGEVHIRKNGATSDTFSATGLNLRTSSNNYANGVGLHNSGNTGIGNFIDDIIWWNGDTSSKPNDWIGDVRAIQCQPVSDAQSQFTQSATGTSLAFGDSTNTSTLALVAGTAQSGGAISATQGGTFSAVNVEFSAGFTGKAKIALYLGDGARDTWAADTSPGTLIATSNEVTNPSTGVNSFTFPSTVGIMKGYTYFFMILTDTNCTIKANPTTATTITYKIPGGYASGMPTDAQPIVAQFISATTVRPTIYVTLTAQNAGLVSDETQDTTTTYVFDSSANDFDLYNLQPLFYTPASVIGVNLRAFAEKSDAGARSMQIAGKSGGTSFVTATFGTTTTFGMWSQFYAQDPNTSADWTPSGVNALQIGPKVI